MEGEREGREGGGGGEGGEGGRWRGRGRGRGRGRWRVVLTGFIPIAHAVYAAYLCVYLVISGVGLLSPVHRNYVGDTFTYSGLYAYHCSDRQWTCLR